MTMSRRINSFTDPADFLNTRTTPNDALRERAIAEYHDLLVADEVLSPAVFEKLHSAMRRDRLLYAERPIGVALRPHLLNEKQCANYQNANTSAKITAINCHQK